MVVFRKRLAQRRRPAPLIKGTSMPPSIHDLLVSQAFVIFARVVLTAFFWIAGLFGLLKFAVMVKAIEAHALPAPRLIVALMVITELAGSALLITDFASLGWFGAGWLGVFSFLSIPLGHPFWNYRGPKKMEEMQIALEHLAVIGGLMGAAILTIR